MEATMNAKRLQVLLVAALATITIPKPAVSQTPADRIAIGAAVLSDVQQRMRSSILHHLFDPIVVRGWWDNGIRRDSVGPVRVRDSAEVATLAAALGSASVTSEMERDCGGTPVKFTCALVDQHTLVVALSDPRVTGDTATLLLRSGPSYYIGSDRPGGGRSGSIGLVRLVRSGGRWGVLCTAGAGTDATPPASEVEARCAASARGRGRGG
jgi:hypothetical protein